MPPEPSRVPDPGDRPDPSDRPEPSGPAELEARLADAAARARATRAVGGALSPRAARDLRARVLAAMSAGGADPAGSVPPQALPEPASKDPTATSAVAARRAEMRVERRRWAREAVPAQEAAPVPVPVSVTPAPAPVPVPVSVTPAPARPHAGRRRAWRTVVRLVALLLVVAMLIGASAYASGRLTTPAALTATVVQASGATVTRMGGPIQLTPGMALQAGDTITVPTQGSAVLGLGPSLVRLAGGSAVHLDRVDAAGITVAQLSGRVYYRDVPAAHAPFLVTTGPVTWAAGGTAFDTDREPVAAGQGSGQERVTLLAIQDAVTASGPGFDTPVPQGDRAVVYIGAATPTAAPVLDGVPASALADPWLQANGAADLAAGLPLGILEGHLSAALASPSASPSPTPFVAPSPGATDTPFPTDLETPTPSPTPSPTPQVTPRTTPGPTPSPTPGIGTLALAAATCPGGVVLDWSTYGGKGHFGDYVTLREYGDPPPVAYPPFGGSIAQVDGTTIRGFSSGFDTTGAGSAFWYRTLAISTDGKVLAASAARNGGGAGGVAAIQDFSAVKDGQDTDFSWTPISLPSACFTEYLIVPTVTTGWSYSLYAPMDTGSVSQVLITCTGQSFEIEAVRQTSLGQLVVATSAPTTCS